MPHNKHIMSLAKIKQMMLLREIIAVYCENHMNHINAMCERNASS